MFLKHFLNVEDKEQDLQNAKNFKDTIFKILEVSLNLLNEE